jgi:hypothetical protein
LFENSVLVFGFLFFRHSTDHRSASSDTSRENLAGKEPPGIRYRVAISLTHERSISVVIFILAVQPSLFSHGLFFFKANIAFT